MQIKRFHLSDDFFMQAVGYLTLVAVALLGLDLIANGVEQAIALSILILFGVLFALKPQCALQEWKKHAYFAAQTVAAASLIALYPKWGVFPMLFFILSAQAMTVFTERPGVLWVMAFTLTTGVIFMQALEPAAALLTLLPFAAGYWFFAAFARALASAERARAESQELLAELQTAHRQLQDYAERVEELAVAEERNRLAREMHDTIGHRLTVAAVQLEGAQRLIPADPQRAEGMIATVRGQVREALAELRRTVAALRQPLQTDLVLPHALQRLADSFGQAAGIQVYLSLPPDDLPLPAPYRLTLYRAAQESLTNVQKHAQARQVWLTLQQDDGNVNLEIRDDGIGLPENADEAEFGLRGLRERAAQLHGQVNFGNRPEGGVRLAVTLPIAPTNEPTN